MSFWEGIESFWWRTESFLWKTWIQIINIIRKSAPITNPSSKAAQNKTSKNNEKEIKGSKRKILLWEEPILSIYSTSKSTHIFFCCLAFKKIANFIVCVYIISSIYIQVYTPRIIDTLEIEFSIQFFHLSFLLVSVMYWQTRLLNNKVYLIKFSSLHHNCTLNKWIKFSRVWWMNAYLSSETKLFSASFSSMSICFDWLWRMKFMENFDFSICLIKVEWVLSLSCYSNKL